MSLGIQNAGIRQRGFGLVEVMIALVVLGAGLLALVRLQTDLLGAGSTSKQRTEATALCQKKLEELRSFVSLGGYDAYFSASATVSGTDPAVTGETAVFTIAYTMTDVRTDLVKGRHANIGVTCSWTDARSHTTDKPQSVRLDSTVARTDPANVGYLAQRPSAPDPPRCPADPEGSGRLWTVNSVNCEGDIGAPGDVGSVVTVSATTNSGLNQYICTSAGTWSEVSSYAKTCTNVCAAQIKLWYGGNGEACVSDAPIASKIAGATSAASDTVPHVTGSATFACANSGNWELQAGSSCTATCPQTELMWGSDPACLADFGPRNSLQTHAITVSSATPETTKKATYQCTTTGSWLLTTSVCNTETFFSCPAQSVEWGPNNTRCFGTLPVSTAASGAVKALDPLNGNTGTAWYLCSSEGTWSLQSSPAATCRSTCTAGFSGVKQSGQLDIQIKVAGEPDSSYLTMCGVSQKNFSCGLTGGGNNVSTSVPVETGVSYTIRTSKKDSGKTSGKLATVTVNQCGTHFSGLNLE